MCLSNQRRVSLPLYSSALQNRKTMFLNQDANSVLNVDFTAVVGFKPIVVLFFEDVGNWVVASSHCFKEVVG